MLPRGNALERLATAALATGPTAVIVPPSAPLICAA